MRTDYAPHILATAATYSIQPTLAAQLYALASDEGFISDEGDKEPDYTQRMQDGFDAFVQHCVCDSAMPGLCTKCGNSQGEVEPDASHYDCEECSTPTISSPLVLLGLI